jgi:hypothetical protein
MQPNNVQFAKELVSQLLSEGWWLALPIIVALFFREAISRAIIGFFWKRGRTYNLDDPIFYNGREGRLVRQNSLVTTFYLYDKKECKSCGGGIKRGEVWTVSNIELGKLDITKPLQNHELKFEMKQEE